MYSIFYVIAIKYYDLDIKCESKKSLDMEPTKHTLVKRLGRKSSKSPIQETNPIWRQLKKIANLAKLDVRPEWISIGVKLNRKTETSLVSKKPNPWQKQTKS